VAIDNNGERLADRILMALQMAIAQEDRDIVDLLKSALEMALTRGSGGKNFVERRDISEEVQDALENAERLKKGD